MRNTYTERIRSLGPKFRKTCELDVKFSEARALSVKSKVTIGTDEARGQAGHVAPKYLGPAMAIVWFASLGFVQFCRTRSHRLLCAAPTRVQPAGHAAACLAALRCPDAWAAFGGVASLCCGGADAYCLAVALSPCWFFCSFFPRKKNLIRMQY